ncbi:sensor domain-containing protein [Bacillus marasmi]|uniref:sensor domain-containing protein n=1 Tax=Bacillus marasmi TaxID=1926279 RepID=UPI0011C8EF1D|nr:bifunctional diguanylate cyclase/phosphodiesterase [Bacillus marasmi]
MQHDSFFQDHQYLKTIFDHLDLAFWSVDLLNGNIFMSKGAETLLGIPRLAFEKNPAILKEFIHPDDQYKYDKVMSDLFKDQRSQLEFRMINQDGDIRWLRVHASTIFNPDLKMKLQYGIIFDITDFINEHSNLTYQNGFMQKLINEVNIVLWSYDLKTKETYYSQSAEELYGVPLEDFTKNPSLWKDVIHPEDVTEIEKDERLLSGRKVTCEYRIIRPSDGDIRWIEDRAFPTIDQNGQVTAFTGVKIDVTARRISEERINQLTFFDVLTGIPNNYYLEQYLNEITLSDEPHQSFAFLLINFDRLKLINDSLGYHFGDLLLVNAIERLRQQLAPTDLLCRIVGDEFAIVLKDVTREDVEQTCHRLLKIFDEPFYIKNKEIYTSISIGISDFPVTNLNRKYLINQAYYAMLLAKENGKNTYYFYNKKDEINKYNIETESELKKALKNEDFVLHFQPLFHLVTGKLTSYEALIRWNHPIKGYIPPSEFIPVAEKTDLIVALGEWVMYEACRQNQQFQKRGFPPVVVSVNVSTRQFYDTYFVKKVKNVLRKTGLDPQYLELEITESIMQNIEKTKPIIEEIKNLGVKISIDDFGTGFSSLSILKHLPLDKLKIDKSFIDDIGTKKEPLVKSIIELGVNLDMSVVAEGVETVKQADFLRENNCDIGQGYLFSKPVPSEQLEEALLKNLKHGAQD